MRKVNTVNARADFSEVVNTVAYGHERIVLTRRGKSLLAMVPMEDLKLLQVLEDKIDLKAVEKALSDPENQERVPWGKIKKDLGL